MVGIRRVMPRCLQAKHRYPDPGSEIEKLISATPVFQRQRGSTHSDSCICVSLLSRGSCGISCLLNPSFSRANLLSFDAVGSYFRAGFLQREA